jgi:hypothetical protein
LLEKDLQIKTSELFFKLLNLYQCVYNQSVPCPSIQILLNQYESSNFGKKISRNKATIQIFWKQVYESNPRNKSFRFGFASPPAWIFKDSGFANLYSTNDLWRFVRIRWIRENRSNLLKISLRNWIHKPNLMKTLRIPDPRYKMNPD